MPPKKKIPRRQVMTTVKTRQHFENIALLDEIEDRDDLKAAHSAIRQVKRKGTIPWTLIKKELGLI
jgi:hypothetical protein